MKKCILSAVFVIAISGYAAAQNTAGKTASPAKAQKEVKKGSVAKKETTDKKASVKAETAVLKLPVDLPPADTTSIPKAKNEQ